MRLAGIGDHLAPAIAHILLHAENNAIAGIAAELLDRRKNEIGLPAQDGVRRAGVSGRDQPANEKFEGLDDVRMARLPEAEEELVERLEVVGEDADELVGGISRHSPWLEFFCCL
jgi:hypothetical protein